MDAKPVPDSDYEERVRASFARQAAMATIGAELTAGDARHRRDRDAVSRKR